MYPSSDQNLSYETDDTVYWFSHAFDPLNNWSAHTVEIFDNRYLTVEHAYHYQKFAGTAPKVAAEILLAPSPWEAFQIARAHRSDVRPDWHEVKVSIMEQLIRAKAMQNEDVRDCLIATGEKLIAENNPWDNYWGTGMQGNGQNIMGKILMKIRGEIKPSVD